MPKYTSFFVREDFPMPHCCDDLEVVEHHSHGNFIWHPYLHEESFENPINSLFDPESTTPIVWADHLGNPSFANATLAEFLVRHQFPKDGYAIPERWLVRNRGSHPDEGSDIIILFLGTIYQEKKTKRLLSTGLRFSWRHFYFDLEFYYLDMPSQISHALLLRK